ncbi:hypothetical protein OH77DRAFT_1424022 [Trametes cingulata]|nr:hypothetical protein OH77DRAFT_1424022 [Trametes cingulata]
MEDGGRAWSPVSAATSPTLIRPPAATSLPRPPPQGPCSHAHIPQAACPYQDAQQSCPLCPLLAHNTLQAAGNRGETPPALRSTAPYRSSSYARRRLTSAPSAAPQREYLFILGPPAPVPGAPSVET